MYCQNHRINHDNNPLFHHEWEELYKKINKTSKNEVLLFLKEKIVQLNEIESSILNQGHIDMTVSKKMLKEELKLVEIEKMNLADLIEKIILATEVSESDPMLFYLSRSPEDAIEKFKEHAPDIEKWKQKIQQNQTGHLEEIIERLINKSCKNIILDMQENRLKLDDHISLYQKEKKKQDKKISEIENLASRLKDTQTRGDYDNIMKEIDFLKNSIKSIDVINDSLSDDFEKINKWISNIDIDCKNQQIEIKNCSNAVVELQNNFLNLKAYIPSTQDRSDNRLPEKISALEQNMNYLSHLIYELKNSIENPIITPKSGSNSISISESRKPKKNSEEALNKSKIETVIDAKINAMKYHYEDKLSWENIQPWWDQKIAEIKELNDKNNKQIEEYLMKTLHSNLEILWQNIEGVQKNMKSLKLKLDEKSDLVEKISKERSINLKKINEYCDEITKIKTDLNNTINLTMPYRIDKRDTSGIANSISYQERSLPNLKEFNNYLNLWKKKEHWLEIYKSEINKTAKMNQDLENLKAYIMKFMQEFTFMPMSICDDAGKINENMEKYNDYKEDLEISYKGIDSDYYEGSELSQLLKECEDLREYQSIYIDKYWSLKNMEEIIHNNYINKFWNFVNEHQRTMGLYEGKDIFGLSSTAESIVELLVYDIESKIQTKIPISDISFPSNTSMAQIPDNRLFCFGFKFPDSKICCIIEKNYDILPLTYSATSREESSCIYFENSIYIFGGSDSNGLPLAVSEKFDLFDLKYFALPDMIAPAKRCSCLRYKNEILICGYEHDKIYRFSVQEITPFEMALDNAEQLCANSDKILFSGKNQVFIINIKVGSIFIVNIDNLVLEPIANNFILNLQGQPYRTYYKNSIYFGFSGGDNADYFKFSLDSHSLEKIAYEHN